jgi:hypothetical protein
VIEYSPTDPDVLDDPFPAYAQLRGECPVHRTDRLGRPLWSVACAADVHAVLTDWRRWSNTKGPGLANTSSGAGDMQHDDPPEHTRRRMFARDWFAPPAVARLEPSVRRVVVGLLDAVRPTGRADLYSDVALPLPVTSFCEIMGIDIADRDQFVEWADELVVSMAFPERGVQARRDLNAFTSDEVARRRSAADSGAETRPGLLSHLAVDVYRADVAAGRTGDPGRLPLPLGPQAPPGGVGRTSRCVISCR